MKTATKEYLLTAFAIAAVFAAIAAVILVFGYVSVNEINAERQTKVAQEKARVCGVNRAMGRPC